MKSLANRPLLRQITITLCCLAVGLFVGVLTGMITLPQTGQEHSSSDLLPTVSEELSLEEYELILAQPHSCQEYQYLEDQIQVLEISRSSMKELESEVVLEQLKALDMTIKKLKDAQRIQLEQHQHDHELQP